MVAASILYQQSGSLKSFIWMKVQSVSFHLYTSKLKVCKELLRLRKRAGAGKSCNLEEERKHFFTKIRTNWSRIFNVLTFVCYSYKTITKPLIQVSCVCELTSEVVLIFVGFGEYKNKTMLNQRSVSLSILFAVLASSASTA